MWAPVFIPFSPWLYHLFRGPNSLLWMKIIQASKQERKTTTRTTEGQKKESQNKKGGRERGRIPLLFFTHCNYCNYAPHHVAKSVREKGKNIIKDNSNEALFRKRGLDFSFSIFFVSCAISNPWLGNRERPWHRAMENSNEDEQGNRATSFFSPSIVKSSFFITPRLRYSSFSYLQHLEIIKLTTEDKEKIIFLKKYGNIPYRHFFNKHSTIANKTKEVIVRLCALNLI